jgi:hypothetical protein
MTRRLRIIATITLIVFAVLFIAPFGMMGDFSAYGAGEKPLLGGTASISGSPRVGATLVASTNLYTDPFGEERGATLYQWNADDAPIIGATKESYKLTANEKDKLITVTITCELTEGSVTSAATNKVVDRPPADSGTGTGDPGTLTITVGYEGSTHITKKIYTEADLRAMGLVYQAYTWIDNYPAPVVEAAKGVPIETLIENAGIDPGSIQRYYFFTKDKSAGWWVDFTVGTLFAPRYYYPNLVASWDDVNHKPGIGASEGAELVTPMIAVEEYWERFAERPIDEKMSNYSCFRLVYGMPDEKTANAHDSAKWVNKIDLLLVGSPPEGWGENDDDDFIGSDDDNKDTGTGNGSGSSDGDGTGSGSGDGNGTNGGSNGDSSGTNNDSNSSNNSNNSSSNPSSSVKGNTKSSSTSTSSDVFKEITLSSGETITGKELSQSDVISMVELAGGGGSGTDKPWEAYEISKQSIPMMVPPPDARVIALAGGSLIAAFIVGSLGSYWHFNPPGSRRRKRLLKA